MKMLGAKIAFKPITH